MTRGIGVHLETLFGVQVLRRLQQPGTQRDRLLMRFVEVIDPQVEVDLLRGAVRPFGRDMIRRQLVANRTSVDNAATF